MSPPPVLVSAIIPVYNGEALLADALESVRRQKHEPLEVIVVDDGSTDRTAKVAVGFGQSVRYVYQANKGPAAARNRGLQMARGGMIAFLDADDLWSDDKLTVQLAHLEQDPTLGLVMGQTQCMRLTGAWAAGETRLSGKDLVSGLGAACNGRPRFEAFAGARFELLLGSALFRRPVFDRVGPFNETLSYSDDWDWFMRAREMNVAMTIHPDVVLFYRQHRHNITRQRAGCHAELVTILKRSLDRRRQAGAGDTPLPNWSHFRSDT
jgi:glycosyltransferase involved in cell wall biosynthesis